MTDPFDKGLGGLESGPERTAETQATRGAPTDAAHPSVTALRERFRDAILHHELHAGDEHVVFIDASRNVEVLRWLRDDPAHRYNLLADLTAVDYGGGRPLQVVYQLWSIPHKRALRVKAELPLDSLVLETVVPLWSTANWLERETYDLFGIEFRGHPDLRRILMPENYAEGYPLRKDFPLRGRFSRAEQTRRALSFDLVDYYTEEELSVMRDWEAREAHKRATGPVEFPEDTAGSRDPRDAGTTAEESR
jgi:NADH-quinone oxidoreductase subunit C